VSIENRVPGRNVLPASVVKLLRDLQETLPAIAADLRASVDAHSAGRADRCGTETLWQDAAVLDALVSSIDRVVLDGDLTPLKQGERANVD
jgi:hypothetical protein